MSEHGDPESLRDAKSQSGTEPPSGTELPSDSHSDGLSPETCWGHLGDCLENIKSLGDFATMKTYQRAPNPVIRIKDEIIPLPLRESDAEVIKKFGRQAPFGKGDKTVVDTDIRRTWELSTNAFRLLNPAWTSFLDTLLKKICEDLGIIGPTDARPHKLLLYEKDSFFMPHKDSQKEKGMVATLVICLPSEHEGGEVHLSHAGQPRTYDTGKTSLFDTTALAWFSDVTHEVKKVVSGHRLVLTYNIIHKSGWDFSAGYFDQQLGTIDHALSQCALHDSKFGKKIYPLEHKYSRAGLSLRDLKGRDLAVCQSLYELCSQHGFYLLLGHMRKEVTRDVEAYEEYEEDDEIILSLDLVNGTNGAEIWKFSKFSEEDLLIDPYHNGRGVDSYEESENLGNEESPDIFKYYDAAAIICRKRFLPTYLGLPPENVNMTNMMQMVMKDIERNDTKENNTEEKDAKEKDKEENDTDEKDTEEKDMDRDSSAPDGVDDSLAVLKSIVRYGRSYYKPPVIYTKMIEWAWGRGYQDLYLQSVLSSMSLTAGRQGMDAVAKIINAETPGVEDKTAIKWDKYLGGAVDKMENLTSLTQSLAEIEKAIADSLKPAFSAWRMTAEQNKFDSKDCLDPEDQGFIIPKLDDSTWLTDCLVPALIARGRKFLVRNVVAKLLERKPEEIRKNTLDAAITILQSTYSNVTLDATDFKGSYFENTKASDFTKFLERTLAHGLNSIVKLLLDAAWAGIELFHKDKGSALPKDMVECFLHRLGRLLQKYEASHLDSTQQLFEFLIRRYMHVGTPSYPRKLPGWSRKPRGCGCGWCTRCKELDTFLRSEDESEHKFDAGKESYSSHSHIECKLPKPLFQCDHDKDTGAMTVSKLQDGQDKEFGEDLWAYLKEVDEFEKPFLELRSEYMEGLLGKPVYQELVMLAGVKKSKGAIQLANNKRVADEPLEKLGDAKLRRTERLDL
ncbi:hypothetical protein F5Y10DRAFT_120384 [Nemania abortiva]|nr:hypothetical protein F5Y10DRAFT_120384 [Nemania abortiva]